MTPTAQRNRKTGEGRNLDDAQVGQVSPRRSQPVDRR